MRFYMFIAAIIMFFGIVPGTFASEKQFFQNLQGNWQGPGKIVAGKYEGTKFVCTFDGLNPKTRFGMEVDGSCRVGVFAQPMNALIIKAGQSYAGKFLDGEKGAGMDITGGRYTKGRLVADIKREDLRGILVANLTNPNALKVTISVHHEGKLVPVIGMVLDRKSYPVVTGSVR